MIVPLDEHPHYGRVMLVAPELVEVMRMEPGHGHVIPNVNGILTRCGGPAQCSECQQEREFLDRLQAAIDAGVAPPLMPQFEDPHSFEAQVAHQRAFEASLPRDLVDIEFL